jgi:hypothetical protein
VYVYASAPQFPNQTYSDGNYWVDVVFSSSGTNNLTVANPASASPNPVTGVTTALSVLAADSGGEAIVTYTWSATGPAAVTFSANGTNAAKNTTATLAQAGSYTLQALLQDPTGALATSSVGVTVSQTATSVTVTPASASVITSGSQTFTAAVKDQFGNNIPSAPVSWSVSGGGTISTSGVFTAGTTVGGPFTVTATYGAAHGTASVTVTAAPSGGLSIWTSTVVPATPWINSTAAVTLGVKFRADTAGKITGIRFYKGAGNNGTHTGLLYSSSGTLLAQATFTGETASGWQQVNLSSAVSILANTTYVAALFTTSGFAFNQNYFTSTGVDNPPLHALKSGVDGGNGVYVYANAPQFPNQTYSDSNYWVDVVFSSGP